MHTMFSGPTEASSPSHRTERAALGRGRTALWALLLASACSAGGSDEPGTVDVNEPPVLGGGGSGAPVQNPGGFLPEGVDGSFTGIPTCDSCTDFPAAPIFEDGLGADTANLFQASGGGAGACVIEPRDGMLIPANMLRPRVRFTSTGDVHQITIQAAREQNQLVVYTRKNPWLIPPEVWQGVSQNVFDEDITVTVRSAQGNQVSAPSSVKFRIAPVQAGGSMIYWAATSTQPGVNQNQSLPLEYTTALMGFSVGEEAVVDTLNPGDVQETMLGDNGEIKRAEYDAPRGQARCVGCHTSTGDGKAVVTVDHWPWNYAVTDISGVGGRPDYMTDLGALLLQMPWLGVSTSSRGDWALGNRKLVTSAGPRPAATDGATLNPQQPQQDMGFTRADSQATGRDVLLWLNLAAEGEAMPDMTAQNIAPAVGATMVAAKSTGGWGVIARTGDTRGAVTPDWSHDGATIAYTSTDSTKDGHVGDNAQNVDIYTVPYNAGAGGTATPVAGASEPGVAEYYPDFSADDRYIAFNRVQNGTGQIYYKREGEIYVVPATGGTAIRLAANDPVACTNEASPGVTNSWPKWSPTVRVGPEGSPSAGNKYYFLLFSSTRQSPFQLQGNGSAPASQLYLATMVEHPDGSIQTYPAMYLWNQGFLITNPDPNNPTVSPIQTSNLTPAFDEFLIPPRPPVIVR
jgi:WD40 repeat protein